MINVKEAKEGIFELPSRRPILRSEGWSLMPSARASLASFSSLESAHQYLGSDPQQGDKDISPHVSL